MSVPSDKIRPDIELSIRLSDDSFESTVRIPGDCDDELRQDFVMAWLNLIEKGAKIAKSKK